MRSTAPDPKAAAQRRTLNIILGVYLATAVIVAIQRTVLSRENNFWIFRAAFEHLRSGADLYAAYPELHTDFFKYSPTFAFLFAPFALLPPTLGYALWAGVCATIVWLGVTRLLPPRPAAWALGLAWLAVLGDLQRAQSNALVAGLMILAWAAFERKRHLGAATAIAAGAFVKIFPLAAAAGAFLHPRWFRFGLFLAAVMAVAAAIPLLLAAPGSLASQYESWYQIQSFDATRERQYGIGGADLYAGVIGQLRVWFGVNWPRWPVQLAGLGILLLPLVLQRARFAEALFRVQFLASLLVFCVLFNHQAESPSYVIAMLGVAIWFAASERTRWRVALLVACIVIVNLGSTDLMPRAWYREYYVPFLLKTVPLIPVWIAMQLELHGLVRNRSASEIAEMDEAYVSREQALPHRG